MNRRSGVKMFLSVITAPLKVAKTNWFEDLDYANNFVFLCFGRRDSRNSGKLEPFIIKYIFENDFLKITFHPGEWLRDGETMWDALSEKGSLGLGCALLEGRCDIRMWLRTVKVWMDVEKVRSALSEIDRRWIWIVRFFFLLQHRQYMNKISRCTVLCSLVPEGGGLKLRQYRPGLGELGQIMWAPFPSH
jgi:hypothetical protein